MENLQHDTDKDWFLNTLNNMVNANGITIGITLVTHGYMISGHLAGGKQYFDAIGNEFSSTLKDTGNVEDSLTQLADRIYNSDSEQVKNGPLSSDYIHIQDAKFYNSSGAALDTESAVWWRGRISEVSGFSLGVVTGNSK